MKAKRSGAGARRPLIDGVDKVTGKAQYTADLPAPMPSSWSTNSVTTPSPRPVK